MHQRETAIADLRGFKAERIEETTPQKGNREKETRYQRIHQDSGEK